MILSINMDETKEITPEPYKGKVVEMRVLTPEERFKMLVEAFEQTVLQELTGISGYAELLSSVRHEKPEIRQMIASEIATTSQKIATRTTAIQGILNQAPEIPLPVRTDHQKEFIDLDSFVPQPVPSSTPEQK